MALSYSNDTIDYLLQTHKAAWINTGQEQSQWNFMSFQRF